jgi:hypothetical protein
VNWLPVQDTRLCFYTQFRILPGIPVGFVFSEGHINTIRGKKVGEVSSKGAVQNEKGTPIGKVDIVGDFLLATGGAALLLLLTEENHYQLS